MRNTGPELTGEWSMLDHTRSRGSEHGIRRLETMLPRGAQRMCRFTDFVFINL